MSVFKYWWLVLRKTWDLFDRGELIISLVLGVLAGIAAGVSPLPIWSIAPIFLAVWLAILFVITPARMHRDQQDALSALRASAAPRLGVAVDRPRWRTDSKGVYLQLRVSNEGKEPLIGCYGKLLDIRRMTGAATAGWIPPDHEPHFQWARYQVGANQLVVTIPGESSFFLSIASTDQEQNVGLLWFAFVEPLPYPLYIVNDLKIEVGASIGTPIRRWYRLEGTSPFDVTVRDIGESDEITEDLYP